MVNFDKDEVGHKGASHNAGQKRDVRRRGKQHRAHGRTVAGASKAFIRIPVEGCWQREGPHLKIRCPPLSWDKQQNSGGGEQAEPLAESSVIFRSRARTGGGCQVSRSKQDITVCAAIYHSLQGD